MFAYSDILETVCVLTTISMYTHKVASKDRKYKLKKELKKINGFAYIHYTILCWPAEKENIVNKTAHLVDQEMGFKATSSLSEWNFDSVVLEAYFMATHVILNVQTQVWEEKSGHGRV